MLPNLREYWRISEIYPREKQDELILKTFDKNKVRIIAKAHRTAAKYGVDMKISDVSLEERTDDVIVY